MTSALAVVASNPIVGAAAAISILVVSVAVARLIDGANEISLTTTAGRLTARRSLRRPVHGVVA